MLRKAKISSFGILILTFLLIRLLLLNIPALIDTSEGRFASVAQQMVKSDDWVTPYIYKNDGLVPYWAKPAGFIQICALSIKYIGQSEFATRLPSFIAGLLILILVFHACNKIYDRESACLAVLITFSSLIFYFLMGACITDMSLALSVSAAYLGFYLNIKFSDKRYGWLCFVALAFGMLIKGPISLALFGLGSFIFILLDYKNAFCELKKLPWLSGLLIYFSISLPWYFWAEIRTPGFLQYFFVSENFLRYFSDRLAIKFGSEHDYFYGTIWPMLLVAFLPWSFLTLYSCGEIKQRLKNKDNLFFLLCGLAPAIFFTFTQHILATYVVSGIPALAIFSTQVLLKKFSSKNIKIIGALTIFIFSISLLSLNSWVSAQRSSKGILQYIKEKTSANYIAFYYKVPYSAYFYQNIGRPITVFRIVPEHKARYKADLIVLKHDDLKEHKGFRLKKYTYVHNIDRWYLYENTRRAKLRKRKLLKERGLKHAPSKT